MGYFPLHTIAVICPSAGLLLVLLKEADHHADKECSSGNKLRSVQAINTLIRSLYYEEEDAGKTRKGPDESRLGGLINFLQPLEVHGSIILQ